MHVPFCLHRCGYCDFTVVAGRDQLIGRYLEALACEFASLGTPRRVNTIFIGGGTPTHLPPLQLSELLRLIRRWFVLRPGYEFSVEANPANLDIARIEVLAEYGANRVSLGIQSFDASILEFLERDHRRADIERACNLLRPHIENFSVDLIFGVPGQSQELWRETLRDAIALGPRHISTYGLTYEKGTTFWSRLKHHEFRPVEEDLEAEMYVAAMEDLAAAGYAQYEISNFAQPGYECRHNQIYWRALPYYGFGPGAAKYLGGRRQTNHRSVGTWMKRVFAGVSPVGEEEELSPEERAREAVMLGLRRTEGIHLASFKRQTGFSLRDLASEDIKWYRRDGLLEVSQGRLRLTPEGRLLADTIIANFL